MADTDTDDHLQQLLDSWRGRIKTRCEQFDIPARHRDALVIWATDGILPGSWLTAVLRNDLRTAATMADQDGKRILIHLVGGVLFEALPSDAWGASDRVHHWQKVGGLRGMFDAG